MTLALLAVVGSLPGASAQSSGSVTLAAPWFGRLPLEPGQIELAVTSSLAATVTGGDARIEVRGLQPGDRLRVERDGTDVTSSLDPSGAGVVDGLRVGVNHLTAVVTGPAGTRRATLAVTNHPITGPVISGPHQSPFVCETEASGLGPALEDDCSARPRVDWFARSAVTGFFSPLTDPSAPYPPDTATTTTSDGRSVPFVVRVDSLTINRSITRIAVLDDPQTRTSAWNKRLVYSFGQSCGTGHHQGVNTPDNALGQVSSAGNPYDNAFAPFVDLPAQLGAGAMTVHSTLTILGVDCNDVISAETLMMVKEHVIETYGPLVHVVGSGASGGAIQQYTAANNYPGLIDAGAPIISFPDMTTTLMTIGDCLVLDRVFNADPLRWPEPKRLAVTGHRTSNICADWDASYSSLLRPTACDPIVPDGVRCTFQDDQVNLWGRDPATGFARRPLDNTGVLYGLVALRSGAITPADFVDLNTAVGGLDIDGNFVDARMDMGEEVAGIAYKTGRVTGRGALTQTPVIDSHPNLDLLPVIDVHDAARSYMVRDRLAGHRSLAVWQGAPYPSAGFAPVEEWLAALEAAGPTIDDASRAAAVVAARPASAADKCTVLGVDVNETEPCQSLAGTSPRIAAGGPLTEDVIKCELEPVEEVDYPQLSAAQLATLRAAFPEGVCDWDAPGVGETARSTPWLSWGDGSRPPTPVALTNDVGRSVVAGASTERDAAALPATGGSRWLLPGLALLALGLAFHASRPSQHNPLRAR
ncbi:MAG: hypothetical protein QOG87_237 [Actinomycetota bacterium]